MRILLVANGYPPAARGGVETYTQAIARALQARGHEVEVFCRVSAPRQPEYALLREQVEGIPVRRVVNDLTGATRFETHYVDPRCDEIFRQHAGDFRPDLVHFQHAVGLSASLLPVARVLGLPVLITLHDYWFICPRATLFTSQRTLCAGPQGDVDCVACFGAVNLGRASRLLPQPVYKRLLAWLPRRPNAALRLFMQRVPTALDAGASANTRHRRQMQARTDYLLSQLKQADLRLAPSQFLISVYDAHGLAADTVELLPLGIDLPVAEQNLGPVKPGGLVIAYLGSLLYHKGPDVLISAFRAAQPMVGELRIYGQGDPQDVYADQLRAAAAGDDRIHFMGTFSREALPGILAGLDLLVVPSRWHETYSLVAREALWAGVPVIGTRLGALPEVIQDGLNGYLVPPGDVGALAQALRRAAAHLPELKANARLTAAAPSLADHVTRLEEHYRQLIERVRLPSAVG